MNNSEGGALLAAINENLNDLAPRLIYSDWLEENGRLNEALAWRGMVAASHPIFDFYGTKYGCESGYLGGSGSGKGEGDAYGSGNRYGYGYGDAYGYRSGSGSGYGSAYEGSDEEEDEYWYGDGYGDKYLKKQNAWIESHNKLTEGRPVIGKQMLIWCGRGFAWIGLVEEMYAPGCYRLSNAGMLCSTGSESWMAVASGVARDNFVYRHAPDGIVYTGPELHGAVEWKGELPGRDVN